MLRKVRRETLIGPTPGNVKKRREVGSSRTKRRISLSGTAALAAATPRTSSSLSTSADKIGWSWASIRERRAKAPLLPLPTTRPKVFRMPGSARRSRPGCRRPAGNAEKRHSFMGSDALDLNLLEPTHTRHLGEPPRVVTIGLDETDRKCTWRASMQITGRPVAFNACESHNNVGPLSRSILDACGARVLG